jgi:WD40 repeat protein
VEEARPAPGEPDRRGFEWHYLHRLLRPDGLTLRAHSASARMAWHPDGSRLASVGADGLVKVWDAASGRELRAFRGHEGPVYGVAYSPDGRRLATSGNDDKVKLWDADTGAERMTLGGQTSHVTAGVSPRAVKIARSTSGTPIRVAR